MPQTTGGLKSAAALVLTPAGFVSPEVADLVNDLSDSAQQDIQQANQGLIQPFADIFNPFSPAWQWAPWNQPQPTGRRTPAPDSDGLIPVEQVPDGMSQFQFRITYDTYLIRPGSPTASVTLQTPNRVAQSSVLNGRPIGFELAETGVQTSSNRAVQYVYENTSGSISRVNLASGELISILDPSVTFGTGIDNIRYEYVPLGDGNRSRLKEERFIFPSPDSRLQPVFVPAGTPGPKQYEPRNDPFYPNLATPDSYSPQISPSRPDQLPRPRWKEYPEPDFLPGLPQPEAPGTPPQPGTLQRPPTPDRLRPNSPTSPNNRNRPYTPPLPPPNPDADPLPELEPYKPPPKEDLCQDPCVADMHEQSQAKKAVELAVPVFEQCGENGPEYGTTTIEVPADQIALYLTLFSQLALTQGGQCNSGVGGSSPVQIKVWNSDTKEIDLVAVPMPNDVQDILKLIADEAAEAQEDSHLDRTAKQALLEAIEQEATKAARRAQILRTIQAVNVTASLHNAAMLSRDLEQSLDALPTTTLSKLEEWANVISENDPIDIPGTLSTTLKGMLKASISDSIWNTGASAWNGFNRILTAAASVLSSNRKTDDARRNVAEWTAEHLGKIGNALKRDGVVTEDAYDWLPERVESPTVWEQSATNYANDPSGLNESNSSISTVADAPSDAATEFAATNQQRSGFAQFLSTTEPLDRSDNIPVETAEQTAELASQGQDVTPADLEKSDDATTN